MRKNKIEKTCLKCNGVFYTFDYRGKFCSMSCAAKFNNKRLPLSEEHKQKISKALVRKHEKNGINPQKGSAKHAIAVGRATIGKYKGEKVTSLLELSKRTVSKILKRMNVKCSFCGWNEASCDIHHIDGRKIADPDNHKNLSVLCPNCHRKVHENKICKSQLITLDSYIGDEWKKFYFG